MSEFDVRKAALGVAEDTVKSLVSKVIMPFAQDYIQKSPNRVDDVILPFLSHLEAELLKLAEKIDGQ